MALARAAFKTAINNLNTQMKTGSGLTDAQYTDALEAALYAYIISGSVSSTVTVTSVTGVTAGLVVSGPGTGTATGTIS